MGDTDPKTGAEGDPKAGGGDDLEKIEGLGDKGKEAIRKERDARDAAESARKAAEQERDALRKEKAEREAAEAKAREKEAAERGQFEELAAKREQERDKAREEAAALRAENDRLRAAIDDVLDAEWKKLPSEVRDAFLGSEDDPIARLAFLPKGKRLADRLDGSASARRGNGANPPASGGTAPTLDQTKQEMARRLGVRR